MNPETKLCVDTMGRKDEEKAGLINCHGQGGHQVSSSKKEHLKYLPFQCSHLDHHPTRHYSDHSKKICERLFSKLELLLMTTHHLLMTEIAY